MYERKIEKEIRCPLEYGLDLISGKWKTRILCVLSSIPALRFGELKEELCNITDNVLNQQLKEMIAQGLIQKEQFNEMPVRVEYRLTNKGKQLVPILQQICEWAGAYHKTGADKMLRQCEKCDHYQ